MSTWIEDDGGDVSSRSWQLGHYITLGFCLLALLYGLNLRSRILNAKTLYTDSQAGIRVQYPRNWLIDTEGGYVFRVRDMSRLGFATTIQVEVRPFGSEMSERNVLDSITLARSSTLALYRELAFDAEYPLSEDMPAVAMEYSFVEAEASPFLESLPIVVRGIDVVTVSRGQAIIITFRSDASTFDDDLDTFDHFLASLEFF